MSEHPAISPELRDWILATRAAGHGEADIVALLLANGYAAHASQAMVAAVLHPAPPPPAPARRPGACLPHHPESPRVSTHEREIAVTAALASPLVRLLDGVLGTEECDALIALARPRLERALTVDASGQRQVDERRTSVGMFFERGETPLIARIEDRLAELTSLPVTHGEGLQVLHYRPGQQYEPHFDWFDPAHPGYAGITRRGGQRVATIVMYLNTPEAGGGTAFPEAGLTVGALRGTAVYFAYPNCDPRSLHAGLPVERGEKWIATKWLRECPFD